MMSNSKKGMAIFLIGTSGSGKTTLARALEARLQLHGVNAQVIDGDILREELGQLFGYTRAERMKNSRVVKVLTKYLSINGIISITALVAPYEEMRQSFREALGEAYIEIYLKCSYDECARRDTKGYYSLQKKGELNNLNGADDIFEVPTQCELTIDTEFLTVDQGVEKILNLVKERVDGI